MPLDVSINDDTVLVGSTESATKPNISSTTTSDNEDDYPKPIPHHPFLSSKISNIPSISRPAAAASYIITPDLNPDSSSAPKKEVEPPREIKTVIIIGAGLVGCVAALAFKKRGYNVKVYEGRPDARTPEQRQIFSYRSINMAVSSRGITTLESIDPEMSKRVLKNLIPMYGRMVHDMVGNEISQAYGLNGEAINSIDRADLNRGLLDELDAAGIETYFNYKLIYASLEPTPKLTFSLLPKDGKKVAGEAFKNIVVVDDGDLIIGCDGAHSALRQHLSKYVRLNFEQEYIDSAYVELRIEPESHEEYDAHAKDDDRKFKLDKNHLHIWPRHNHMLIALPNQDGSFTSTLFGPWSLFDSLDTEDKWFDFFWNDFPDVFEKGLMTRKMLVKAFHENPRGSLVCVRCSPYHYKDRCIILGDAAHSMVPFYGQGMNCGFEDVKVLMSLLDKHNGNCRDAFDEYSATRHKDLTAIIDLAMRNYVEMRHKVVSTSFLLRKKLDGVLSRILGNHWLPLYTMVTFRPDISYSEAMRRENLQAKIINDIVYYGTGLAAITGVVTFVKLVHKLARN